MTALSHYEVLVGMETDATAYHGEEPQLPHPLDKAGAEQLAAHLGADLTVLIPEISKCTVTVAAGLYDQTQVLRPGFPLFAALQQIAESSSQVDGFRPKLLSIGASGGQMPNPALQPDPEIPPSVLQLVPLVISGEETLVKKLGAEMEHLFLEQGQLSANASMWMQQALNIKIIHGRFMTLVDLTAMLQLQLDSFNFTPLWELVECALFQPGETVDVQTGEGNSFSYRNGVVLSPFYSFDQFAGEGPGSDIESAKHRLAKCYADWTRVQRQYLMTLRSHGLKVLQHLPGKPTEPVTERFLVEVKPEPVPGGGISITEHNAGELGTVAITAIRDDRQYNYYPLTPAGLNDIHSLLRDLLGSNAELSFPGYICYNEQSRSLTHDLDIGRLRT